MWGGSRGAGHISCVCQLCFRDFYARESVMDRFVHSEILFGQDATRRVPSGRCLYSGDSTALNVHTASTKPCTLIQNALDGSRSNTTVYCFLMCHSFCGVG